MPILYSIETRGGDRNICIEYENGGAVNLNMIEASIPTLTETVLKNVRKVAEALTKETGEFISPHQILNMLAAGQRVPFPPLP